MEDGDLEDYLTAINASQTMRSRLAQVMPAFRFLSPEPIEQVFVCDRLAEDGKRSWTDLWAFTAKYWLDAQRFMSEFDADISGYKKSIKYLSIQFEHMDFDGDGVVSVTERSSMTVEVETGDDLHSELTATGANCRFLGEIVYARLKENLRPEVI